MIKKGNGYRTLVVGDKILLYINIYGETRIVTFHCLFSQKFPHSFRTTESIQDAFNIF